MTSRDFAFERCCADDPLESFAAIERMPDPTCISRGRTGRAGVNGVLAVRIDRWIDANRFLEPSSANAGDDWMTERWQIGGGRADIGI